MTVVPTATTRWPAPRAALTWRAVWSPTSSRSGCGPSPASCDDTPVWRVTGATEMPRATSRVISDAVNGRPAEGISALPGTVAKTDW